MTAYYNEIEPYAAQWLRNLIAAGHIAPGVVDTRSISDVRPSDLRGFTQCHFFAGIGVWSHALRLAGVPDDQPVWTGSCPCQPFSAAGKGDGFGDERHLWPDWYWLIDQCRPAVVFGEQVASKPGLEWLDLVHADLESAGYAFGAADLCAAGVGAPHIRQRLWFVGKLADADSRRRGQVGRNAASDRTPHAGGPGDRACDGGTNGEPGRMAHSSLARLEGRDERALGRQRPAAERGGGAGALADDDDSGLGEQRGVRVQRQHVHDADGRGANGELEYPAVNGRQQRGAEPIWRGAVSGRSDGFWSRADWIACRDGKSRPVEPGTFPLAHGAPARVGRLRAYGNAIVPQAAAAFIAAALACRP